MESCTKLEEVESDDTSPMVLSLRDSLCSCSNSIESGNESKASELVSFIDSISDAALLDPENEEAEDDAFRVVSEIHRFLFSPSLDQTVRDVFSLELPKAVSCFAGLSDRCLEIADNIIDVLITTSNPRDMLPILCEALDSSSKTINASRCVAPLLNGLSKVFVSIKRRQFEQVKEAIPVILNVLKVISLELNDQDMKCINLFDKALCIADSIRSVCEKLEGRTNEKLRMLVGLYVLQIMALLSLSVGHNISSCLPSVCRMAGFLTYSGFSYHGLITGSEVDAMTRIVFEDCNDEEGTYTNCFCYIKHGASLSVVWGHISDEVAQAARENISSVKYELQTNQTARWGAVRMLNHIISSYKLPWELMTHTIDFLLSIADKNATKTCNDENTDCSIYMPSLCDALQAISKVMIYSPNATLKKNAFEALKRVHADIPTSQKFDIILALMTNSCYPSMNAILMDLVRMELHGCRMTSDNQTHTSLWNADVLNLVKLVLRPPNGGPPPLPEHSDPVLAALNLYRYILMTESSGNTNLSGVLSKENLEEAYNEWLLPLRTLVSGIMAENRNDYDQQGTDIVCALNPVELVLYLCIELVENKIKSCNNSIV
ncbi:hypothetical protein K2173_025975 [Erythroxylum novogranatense]|uniref:Aberrant root formation protein 4 n=1 Tax=Erythroxylum novogranatense TaxID=1862640 RepID=A0AAV8SII8_9ROSI|nr:hypothetical protein K2173_025975 [Erythroxylum novogranatense]